MPDEFATSLDRARRYGVMLAGATLGAWLMTTPIIAYHFHSVVLVGIIANIIVVPLRVIVMALGFVTFMLGAVSEMLAVIPAGLAKPVLWTILQVVQSFSRLQPSALDGVYFSMTAVGCWYLGAGVVWWLLYGTVGDASQSRRSESRRRLAVAVFGIGAAGLLVGALWSARSHNLRIAMLDVGQGLCMIISTPDNHHVMVDAGSGASSPGRYRYTTQRIIRPYLARASIRSLDAVIMSHADADHCNAIPELFRATRCRAFLINRPPAEDDLPALEACQAASERGVPIRILHRGETLHLGRGVLLSVLHPPPEWIEDRDMSDNDCSLVLRVAYEQVSFLLPGDIETIGEDALVDWVRASGARIQSDVLVLPHHGSRTSSTVEFIDAVRPSFAVSSGARPQNRPGYLEVLQRLRERNIPLVSTDERGTIIWETDGRELWRKSYAETYSFEFEASSWQSTAAARKSSTAAQFVTGTDRCWDIEEPRRRARSVRTAASSSSRLRKKRLTAATCSSVRRWTWGRKRSWSGELGRASAAGGGGAAGTGKGAERSLTTTVPAA
jgi:competence protein ComEC